MTRPASRPLGWEGAGRGNVSLEQGRGAKAGVADLLRRLETSRRGPARVLTLGLPALDAALPDGGLALGRLHEVVAQAGEAGTGFAAALLARIAAAQAPGRGSVLWCGGPAPYGPGLAEFGLDPDRVIFVRSGPDAETLWAMEEALRCPALAGVLGEVEALDLTAGRRLQLAAERHGVTAIALRRQRRNARLDPSAATTRWRVAPIPGAGGAARWNVELLRCRGGTPRDFVLEWSHAPEGPATGSLAVAAAADHGSASPFGPGQADAAD